MPYGLVTLVLDSEDYFHTLPSVVEIVGTYNARVDADQLVSDLSLDTWISRGKARIKFKKGQSGNPAGKPKGTKDKRTELRDLLRPHAPALIQKAVALALEGDTAALKLCLDKLAPNLRPREDPIPLKLPGESLTEKSQSILEVLAAGVLTPTEAKELLTALAGLARIVEVDELLSRVEALEAKHHE